MTNLSGLEPKSFSTNCFNYFLSTKQLFHIGTRNLTQNTGRELVLLSFSFLSDVLVKRYKLSSKGSSNYLSYTWKYVQLLEKTKCLFISERYRTH